MSSSSARSVSRIQGAGIHNRGELGDIQTQKPVRCLAFSPYASSRLMMSKSHIDPRKASVVAALNSLKSPQAPGRAKYYGFLQDLLLSWRSLVRPEGSVNLSLT